MTKRIFAAIAIALGTAAASEAQTPPAQLDPPSWNQQVPAGQPVVIPQPIVHSNFQAPAPQAGPAAWSTGANNQPPPPNNQPGVIPSPIVHGSLLAPTAYDFSQPAPVDNVSPPSTEAPSRQTPFKVWGSVDYLLWWVKPGPSPNPLVTTGSASDAVPGGLGQPHTMVIFGEQNLDFGTNSGVRFNGGVWLGDGTLFGIDGSFFGLERRSSSFSASGNTAGSPVLARPIINAQSGNENVYVDSFPGLSSGGVSSVATTQLQSWEINLDTKLFHVSNFGFDVLAGFRALGLNEDFTIQDSIVPLVSGVFTFQGNAVNPPSTLADFDRFHTYNYFYGGQLGTRLTWNFGNLDLTMTAKVALGQNQEVIDVEGTSSLFTPGAKTVTVPGGILAQPTNIGRTYRTDFSLAPEGTFNLGYQITPWLRAQVGYTFLYWTNVVRPGTQIDRTVNPTQVPTDASFGTLTGPARPVLTPQLSDFSAQGINLGLEFRF
jgi:hypothetical protein